MTDVVVTDTGFASDDWSFGFVDIADLPQSDNAATRAIDVAPDSDLAPLAAQIDRIDMIRVAFPSFADGRGFTIARQLRRMGFQGRLRAQGHVLSDQYAMARRSGFDEVQIGADLAARQGEDQWLARANWQDNHYQARLRG